MGNIHLVTGFAGHQHITSADQAVFNALMFGGGQYVLAKGNQFAASIVTNNQVNVLDGEILMQGRHIRLNEATSVDLTIENGTQGAFRNDLIVVRYTKDEDTGIEDANLVVIKGTAAESDPADPEYTSGDLISGHAILNDMPLYRVQLDGLNISGLVPLFDAITICLASHANRHASGGDDAITPAMIDAADRTHTHTAADVGAVSKSGDTMHVGARLHFKASNGTGLGFKTVSDGSNITAFDNAEDESSNRMVVKLYPPSLKPLAEAMRLAEVRDGKNTWSTVLHTGNINSLYPAANVVTGQYFGTNTFGADNKNAIALPGEPALLVIQQMAKSGVLNSRVAFWIRGAAALIPIHMADYSDLDALSTASWNADTSSFEWYTTSNAYNQMNGSSYYVYTAIY